jgi:RNase adaptor protein for sRNA GlmZ degradation
VLIRLLQTFGAYGFRGFYENKTYFLKSIPFALKNLLWLFDKNLIPSKLKQLKQVLSLIVQNEELKKFELKDQKKLKVTINSFSYKKGIPVDYSGNGGGFVFDCRSLNNPGRYPEYSGLTGKDESVIKFLEAKSNVNDFLNSVYSLINDAVKDYKERNFTNLLVNFGCTGGQHRSVYCAEKLADHLKNKLGIEVEVNHTGLESDDIIPG